MKVQEGRQESVQILFLLSDAETLLLAAGRCFFSSFRTSAIQQM